jgi:hypothetical protein
MSNHFNATEHGFCKEKQHTMPAVNFPAAHFTFFRDPMTRFVSGFSEITSRRMRNTTPPQIPTKYAGFLGKLDNHLHNESLIAPKTTSFLQRYYQLTKTAEGMKAFVEVFEKFVEDYDGLDAFDVHIAMQVPGKVYLIQENLGVALHFAFQMEDGLVSQIQNVLHANLTGRQTHSGFLPSLTETKTRPNSAGSTSSVLRHLSNATLQKICKLSALDFCCLNYPLPPMCQDVVQCQWTNKTMMPGSPERTDLLSIEPVSPMFNNT